MAFLVSMPTSNLAKLGELEAIATQGWMQGTEQLRAWWKGSFEKYPALQYQLRTVAVTENEVFIAYVRKADAEPDKEVFEYFKVEGKQIVESRVLRGFVVSQ